MRGVGNAGRRRLERLRDLPSVEIDRDSIDVRGWPVHARGGERLGVVADLLVDAEQLTAMYLMVDPRPDAFIPGEGPVFLVPIASARMSAQGRLVTTSLGIEELAALPVDRRRDHHGT